MNTCKVKKSNSKSFGSYSLSKLGGHSLPNKPKSCYWIFYILQSTLMWFHNMIHGWQLVVKVTVSQMTQIWLPKMCATFRLRFTWPWKWQFIQSQNVFSIFRPPWDPLKIIRKAWNYLCPFYTHMLLPHSNYRSLAHLVRSWQGSKVGSSKEISQKCWPSQWPLTP